MRPRILFVSAMLLAVVSQGPLEAGDAKIISFTPTVGWAGTTNENGTFVRITAIELAPLPADNEVFFFQDRAAPVLWMKQYEWERTFGGRGNAPGDLNSPIGIAVDATKVYVTSLENKQFGAKSRIDIFRHDGTHVRRVGVGSLKAPWGVAVDGAGKIYVTDVVGTGSGKVLVFSASGASSGDFGSADLKNPRGLVVVGPSVYVTDANPPRVYKYAVNPPYKQQASMDASDQPFRRPVDVAYDSGSKVLYVLDDMDQRIHRFNQYDTAMASWSIPDLLKDLDVSDPPPSFGIAVDKDGNVYVTMSQGIPSVPLPSGAKPGIPTEVARVFKFSSSGDLISQLDSPSDGRSAVDVAVDGKGKVFLTDNQACSCVRVFRPAETQELGVRVPPGAVSGQIKIKTPASSHEKDGFTVIPETPQGPMKIKAGDITQGLVTYPYIVRKETLIWARLDGLFGHPTQDTVEVTVTRTGDGPRVIGKSFDHLTMSYQKKETTVHFHFGRGFVVSGPGEYTFGVRFKRGNTVLASMSKKIDFNETRNLKVLFVKFTGVPEAQWDTQDPFPWFDIRSFLYGIDTVTRMFPVQAVSYRIAPSKYVSFMQDGHQKADRMERRKAIQVVFNEYADSDPAGLVLNRIVAILKSGYKTGSGTGVAGAAQSERVWVGFSKIQGHIKTWGKLVSHELGHTYGLVPKSQPNYVKANGGHSKNVYLDKEWTPGSQPLRPWSAIPDRFLTASTATSVMGPGMGLSDNAFFESKAKPSGTTLCYHHLFDRLKTSGKAAKPAVPAGDGQAPKFVVVGSIGADGAVSVSQSFLTTSDLPITPSVASGYSIVFADAGGQILSQQGLSVGEEMADEGPPPPGRGMFSRVSLFPAGTARVELRYGAQVLKTLVPSANPPAVQSVSVQVRPSMTTLVSWTASDPDGDPLTYSVQYSADGGTTFEPVGYDVAGSRFVWDDALYPGSEDAVIRVVANDGFYRGSADSAAFSLPAKAPLAAILVPDDGTTFPEGSRILLRGAAFDPEDGELAGGSLSWRLETSVDLGTGVSLTIHETALGHSGSLRPGLHTVTLLAEDGDGNVGTDEIEIEIVPDTDRDGFSDRHEEIFGGDPIDPSVGPPDLDQDDDGVLDATEDRDLDGETDPGEMAVLDPDTDGDGIFDGTEIGLVEPESDEGHTDTAAGFFVPDADGSTLTDPLVADSDGDGVPDGLEDANRNGRVDLGESDPLRRDPERTSAWVDLGDQDQENGLANTQTGDGGDGENDPVACGPAGLERDARMNRGDADPTPDLADDYMYFTVLDPAVKSSASLVVSVTLYDAPGLAGEEVRLQYTNRRARGPGDVANVFAEHYAVYVLGGSDTWRTLTWEIPDAGFRSLMRGTSDFRLVFSDAICVDTVEVIAGLVPYTSIRFSPAAACRGGSVRTDVLLTNAEPAQGFSLGIGFPPDQLGLEGITLEDTVCEGADFFEEFVESEAGWSTVGVILSTGAEGPTIPPGEDQPIAGFVFSVGCGAAGSLALRFEDGHVPNILPVDNEVTVNGIGIRPLREDGAVVVANLTEAEFSAVCENGRVRICWDTPACVEQVASITIVRDGVVIADLSEGETCYEDDPCGGASEPTEFEYAVVITGACGEIVARGEIVPCCGVEFRRGDCTNDGTVDIGDAIRILGLLFVSETVAPDCMLACEVNGDDVVTIADAVYALQYLFVSGPPPAPPGPTCGPVSEDPPYPCPTYPYCP